MSDVLIEKINQETSIAFRKALGTREEQVDRLDNLERKLFESPLSMPKDAWRVYWKGDILKSDTPPSKDC